MARSRKNLHLEVDRGDPRPEAPSGELEVGAGRASSTAQRTVGQVSENVDAGTVFFASLCGAENSQFDIALVEAALNSLDQRLPPHAILDDYIFQSSVRWLGCLHSFLGGSRFQASLAEEVSVADSTVFRWVSGQSAPAPTVRRRSISAAKNIIDHALTLRREGVMLSEMLQKSA